MLALDGMFHAIWATGFTWPAADQHHLSLAVMGFATSFAPSTVIPLALVLWTAAGLVLLRGRLGREHRFSRALQLAAAAVTAGVATRGALGLLWLLGGLDGPKAPFFWLNALIYVPLCAVLAVLGWRLLGAGVRPGRRVWSRVAAAGIPALLVAGTLTAAYGFEPKGDPSYSPRQALGSTPSRYVDTPVARFHYLREGSGPAIVLLSPGSAWASSWLPQLRALSATHTVYVVDLPGQGFTKPKGDFAYNLDGMTGAIDSFLGAVGVKSTVLAGNSWSGGWALAYAQRHPAQVSKLMLLAPSGLDEPDPTSWELFKLPVTNRALANLSASKSVTQDGVRKLFAHPDRATQPLLDAFWAAGTRPENLRATYALEVGLDWSVTEEAMPRTTQPTLIIWGRQDTVLPVGQAREFERRMPAAQVHELDRCGHALTLDCPDQVNALMTGFVRAG